MFPILGTPIYIPTKSVHIFIFCHILANIYLCSSDDCYFGRCEGVTALVWVCISLKITDVKHHSLCLFAICISSLEKCLLRTLPFFKWSWFFCLLFSCMNSLYILNISPLQNIWIANIFSCFISLFYFVYLCYNSSCYYLLFLCV